MPTELKRIRFVTALIGIAAIICWIQGLIHNQEYAVICSMLLVAGAAWVNSKNNQTYQRWLRLRALKQEPQIRKTNFNKNVQKRVTK